MQLTNSMLIDISRKIDRGYPITALATANFYLKPDCPLRLALVKKARLTAGICDKTGEQIFQGQQVESRKLSETIRKFDTGKNRSLKKTLPKKMNYLKRLRSCRRNPCRVRIYKVNSVIFRKLPAVY